MNELTFKMVNPVAGVYAELPVLFPFRSTRGSPEHWGRTLANESLPMSLILVDESTSGCGVTTASSKVSPNEEFWQTRTDGRLCKLRPTVNTLRIFNI